MRRLAIIAIGTVAVLASLGLLAPGSAAADDDLVQAPCAEAVETSVRAQLGGTLAITCEVHKTAPRSIGRERIAGRIDAIRVVAVLSDGRIATLSATDDGTILSTSYAHGDTYASGGGGMALLFWLFAAASVIGAVFVVTRRNLIAAVMGMVGSFLGIAAIYMLLYAQFLAVIQMLVYAGAIMVLFVFVVMILNRPEDEPVAPSGRLGQALGGLAILYLVARLVIMLLNVQPPNPAVANAAPPPLPEHCVAWKGTACVQTDRYDWGSIGAVGSNLFNEGLFPFEAISILLLVAVVGAIAIARPLHADDDDPAKKRSQGGVA